MALDRTVSARAGWASLLAVYVATLVFCTVWLWWMWHPMPRSELHGVLEVARRVAGMLAVKAWLRAVCLGGTALVAVTTLVLTLRTRWSAALAVPCSASLLAITTGVRWSAVFAEPRGYVARSAYVHAATSLWLPLAALHVGALILGLSALARSISADAAAHASSGPEPRDASARAGAYAPPAAWRLSLAAMVLLAALPTVMWSQSRGQTHGLLAGVALSSLAAGAAAALAAAWPRRAVVTAAAAVCALAALVMVSVLALALRAKANHRGIYVPAVASEPLLAATFGVPSLAVLLILTWIGARALRAGASPARDAARPS